MQIYLFILWSFLCVKPPVSLNGTVFYCMDCLDYYDECTPVCESECKTALLFLDDKTVLREDHCWSDFSYRKGIYLIENQKVTIQYETKSIDYTPSDPSGKLIHQNTEQNFTESYQLEKCNGKTTLQLRSSSYDMFCSEMMAISTDSLASYKSDLRQKGVAKFLGFESN